MFPFARGWAVVLAVLWLAAGGGCGKSVDELLDKAKETVADGTEKVKGAVSDASTTVTNSASSATQQVQQQAGLSGSFELGMSPPLTVRAAFLTFVPPNGGRPAVVQLKSYRDAASETFPSVYVHARVTCNSLAEVVGETVEAQVFVQPEANGPVWQSAQPVSLKLGPLEEKALRGEFVSGQLQNSQSGATSNLTGKFVALTQ